MLLHGTILDVSRGNAELALIAENQWELLLRRLFHDPSQSN